MRVIAITIWYDESPHHLDSLALSLAGFADGLVAVDGSYSYYPHRNHLSPTDQATALTEGCEDAGIEFLLHRPRRKWDGEVEKRNASLAFAASFAPDWVVIVDGDTEIGSHEGSREILANTKFDVATTRMIDDETVETRGWCDIRNVFRYSTDLCWWRTHYMVKKGEKLLFCPLPPAERAALDLPPLASACSLRDLTMIHHPKTADRRAAAEASYVERDRLGIEDPSRGV